ncbi:hypothetical protein [Maridesulfovibrio sp.]|uniref:hypothetical protein n=1 Tax=Maridesulfovibrio sp. TaxID=2795000 RepID=UPI002AA8FE0D|nr:hypothetical protein [Maridesulfovibrio sp.]
MATGITSMFYSGVFSAAMGAASRGISGQNITAGNIGMDALGGAVGGGLGSMLGGAGGGLSSLSSTVGSSGTAGSTSGDSGSAGSSMLGGSDGGMNYLGLMTQFGQSALSSSQDRSEVEYNSQLTEMNNYHLMQQGIYNRSVSYKEAQLIKQDAEIKLATLRRELYRRNHSVSGYKGVRLDSGSIVDVREDTVRQAAYDAEIVKYQAEVNSNRMIERGDMSVWSAHSNSILNYNRTQEETNAGNAAINSGLISQGTKIAGSMLSSNMGGIGSFKS